MATYFKAIKITIVGSPMVGHGCDTNIVALPMGKILRHVTSFLK